MNVDASGPAKNWHDNLAMLSGRVRSYSCSFCERGFSNAQALGGHMNVHRKDRARLRGFSDENFPSLGISDSPACEQGPPVKTEGSVRLHLSDMPSTAPASEVITRKTGRPDGKSEDPGFGSGVLTVKKMGLVDHGEVDLELRLGLEPHDAKKSQ